MLLHFLVKNRYLHKAAIDSSNAIKTSNPNIPIPPIIEPFIIEPFIVGHLLISLLYRQFHPIPSFLECLCTYCWAIKNHPKVVRQIRYLKSRIKQNSFQQNPNSQHSKSSLNTLDGHCDSRCNKRAPKRHKLAKALNLLLSKELRHCL